MKCLHCQGRGKRLRIVGRVTVNEPWYAWQNCTYCKGTGRTLMKLTTDILPALFQQPAGEHTMTLRAKHKSILF